MKRLLALYQTAELREETPERHPMTIRPDQVQNAEATVYYWRAGFILVAPSFQLDRRQNPYRRLSATLIVARSEPFLLETGVGTWTASALLIRPKVERLQIRADRSDLMICDLSLTSHEFSGLAPLLTAAPVMQLGAEELQPLTDCFDSALDGALPIESLRKRLHQVLESIGAKPLVPRPIDARIATVMRLIDEHPLDATSLEWLAQEVHLSPSRLRHLFKEELGSNLTHYLRWAAIWKGVWLWSHGRPLSEIATLSGFHDSAHFNRAINEVFGLNPSTLLDPSRFRLIRAAWE